jgi:plastocyanin
MGASTPHTDILAFSPTPAAVKAGDKVTFLNDSGAPHTASFFGEGSTPIVDPTDPRTDAPAPGPSPQTLSAKGFFNTGLLPPNAPPGSGPPEAVRKFTFNIPAAGDYAYVCILHSPSTMVGTIKAS